METTYFDIQTVNLQICNKLDNILPYFGIEYSNYGQRVSFSCPIHNSDKYESSCIYKDNGRFYCWTRHCEEDIGFSVYNLFKTLLKKKNHNKTIMRGLKT